MNKKKTPTYDQALREIQAMEHLKNAREFEQQGDYSRAFEEFNRAIELDPNYGYAYFRRGIAFDDVNMDEKAIADLEMALKLGLGPEEEILATLRLRSIKRYHSSIKAILDRKVRRK
jgi:tetratricopeptide (TPR) repeat protein